MNNAHKYYYNRSRQVNWKRLEPVAITEYSLRVGNRLYPLEEISKFDVGLSASGRRPGILTIALGVTFFALGVLNNNQFIPELSLIGKTISGNIILQIAGAALCTVGMVGLALTRKFYVLRIVMGMEELDVLARRRKSEVNEIVIALNKRLDKSQPRQRETRPYTWTI